MQRQRTSFVWIADGRRSDVIILLTPLPLASSNISLESRLQPADARSCTVSAHRARWRQGGRPSKLWGPSLSLSVSLSEEEEKKKTTKEQDIIVFVLIVRMATDWSVQ